MALTYQQSDFINFLEQYWYEHGTIPTKDYANSLGLNADVLWKHFSSADFRDAVLSRGISLRGLAELSGPPGSNNKSNSKSLTELQLGVANALLDLRDNRSQKNKLKDFGVSTLQYQGWLRDPVYKHYIQTRAEHYLGDNQHEAHLALVERVRVGDVSAIKYFNELTGRYVPSRDGNTGVDVNMLLLRVIEAVQKHVPNPEIQEAIAKELLQFAQAREMTRQLASSTANTASLSSPVGAQQIAGVVI